jgi:hypothetical protein
MLKDCRTRCLILLNKQMKQLTVTIVLLFGTVGTATAAEDLVPPASSRFAQRDTQAVPDFQKHVVPLLGRLGCNSAKCHGSFQGQGGFRLSLFGFDFNSDHQALRADSRISSNNSDQSLVLRKPTEQTDHEGGRRFNIDSWEHNLLRRWIQSGAHGVKPATIPTPGTSTDGRPTRDGIDFFTSKIKPLIEDHCYECHGFNNRKGGLSLRTRDGFLTGGESGAAVIPGKPDNSLLLSAVRYSDESLQMPPSGKLKPQQIADIEQWVRLDAPWPDRYQAGAGDTNQVLISLRYEPEEIVFRQDGETSQIKVIAQWNSGEREDVTCLSRFQTNNDGVVTVDRDGLTTSMGEGDTHIVAFYDNGVAAIPVLRPVSPFASRKIRNFRRAISDHPIDRFINAKLNKLSLIPSELCTDAEFLRRVSIDMTGTLPTPDEVKSFLADKSKDKRNRKIEELLQRPIYAAWWANKLCDFTGCNPRSISSLLEVAREDGYVKATEWYDWIHERVANNDPYDKLAEGIMLAELSFGAEGMPYFWTRQSLQDPKDTAMSVAHAFLGIQLQCAECHKHPFDRWTQADFNQFSQFFESVTTTKRRSFAKANQSLSLLRSHVVSLQAGDDPRKPIMDWMRDPKNPWFARAFVNRVWAGYFHIGIVDPPGQFTPSNPPSNPQVLDWLTQGFIENGFDMKWLHRQVTSSATYQRGWKPNETNASDRRNFSRAIPRRIPAEVVYDAMKQATAATDKQNEVRINLRRRASGHLSMRMAGTHAMKVFGKPDRSINCDCERVNEPTLLQAIFAQNDPLVRMRIADSGWIIEIEDADAAGRQLDNHELVEQVWLRTVSRRPTDEELARSVRHVESVDTVVEGVSDLMWAMLNTKEFLLNH